MIILAVFPSSQMMKMNIGMLKFPKSPNILPYKLKREMIKILDVRLLSICIHSYWWNLKVVENPFWNPCCYSSKINQ